MVDTNLHTHAIERTKATPSSSFAAFSLSLTLTHTHTHTHTHTVSYLATNEGGEEEQRIGCTKLD